MQVILRPVYNRPEMLFLSLEYEVRAREYFSLSDDFLTIFIMEHGSPQKTIDLVDSYPFSKEIIQREEKFGLSKNILEGMKAAFDKTDDYIIYIEDDVLVYKHYFQYMDVLLSMDLKYSVLSPFNGGNTKDVSGVYLGHHYAALAPLISKEFFKDYVEPCAKPVYYDNRARFVKALNAKYSDYHGKGYKLNTEQYNEQAGLINRMVDVAMIEEEKYVVHPYSNRQVHIGYFGKNRPGGKIPGKTFEERVNNLREIIKDPKLMFKMSPAKYVDDYRVFIPELENWDGTLSIREIRR